MKHKKIILITLGIIGALVFFTIPLGNEINSNTLDKTKCYQIFDNYIVPILNGYKSPSQIASAHWIEFNLEKCASNHAQWEKYSIYYESINKNGWDSLIKLEENELLKKELRD